MALKLLGWNSISCSNFKLDILKWQSYASIPSPDSSLPFPVLIQITRTITTYQALDSLSIQSLKPELLQLQSLVLHGIKMKSLNLRSSISSFLFSCLVLWSSECVCLLFFFLFSISRRRRRGGRYRKHRVVWSQSLHQMGNGKVSGVVIICYLWESFNLETWLKMGIRMQRFLLISLFKR